jgi:hypothetical protein
MADFLFRSRRANVGHGVRFLRPVCFTGTEGPQQHLNLTRAPCASNQFDRWMTVHASPKPNG